MNYLKAGFVVLVVAFVALGAAAPARRCSNLLAKIGIRALSDGQIKSVSDTILASAEVSDEVKTALRAYRTLRGRWADLDELLPPNQVMSALVDPTMVIYGRNLGKILTAMQGDRSTRSREEKLYRAVEKTLKQQVPEATIPARLEALKAGKKGAVIRALGENTLAEVSELLYGDDFTTPSSGSLLGKYLAETGATTKLENFLPEGRTTAGPERLVVAVDQASFPAFQKYFSREEFLSVVGHAMLIHDGKVVGLRFEELRLPHVGTVLPWVLLSTTEGQRATQYFQLWHKLAPGGWNWNHVAAQPWLLRGYSATGGYSCCTHWIGNMPLGDKLVESYSFPGRFENNQPARRQKLKKYQSDDPLVKRVWTVPGHEQFANMIGQGRSNLSGDFAATNLVVSTLIGPTKTERVPIVFQVVADHTQPIPDDYVSPH